MKKYSIKISNPFGKYKICEWEAETADKAVEEFKEMNPEYKNKGLIIAE